MLAGVKHFCEQSIHSWLGVEQKQLNCSKSIFFFTYICSNLLYPYMSLHITVIIVLSGPIERFRLHCAKWWAQTWWKQGFFSVKIFSSAKVIRETESHRDLNVFFVVVCLAALLTQYPKSFRGCAATVLTRSISKAASLLGSAFAIL